MFGEKPQLYLRTRSGTTELDEEPGGLRLLRLRGEDLERPLAQGRLTTAIATLLALTQDLWDRLTLHHGLLADARLANAHRDQ